MSDQIYVDSSGRRHRLVMGGGCRLCSLWSEADTCPDEAAERCCVRVSNYELIDEPAQPQGCEVVSGKLSQRRDSRRSCPRTRSVQACEWKRDGDGGYYVKCGDFRVKTPRQLDIDEGGTAHNFAYCPYCGGRLTITDNVRVPANNGNRP